MMPSTGGAPEPKTITFNARPEDEAQFRSARLGNRIVSGLVMVPALLCLTIAGLYNLVWAMSVGASWGERGALALISLALTCCVGGLPVASVLLASTYPRGAKQAISLWWGAVYLCAFSAFYFVATRDWAMDGATHTATPIAWVTGGYLDERQTRALIYLLLSLFALAGGGQLLRLGVLAHAESWRLGVGQAKWSPEVTPAAAPEAVQALPAMASQTPEEIFGMWANGRLRLQQDAYVQGIDAYNDYQEACRLSGIPALSVTKFGNLMTARAASTEGRINKGKSGGNIVYRGWELIGQTGGETREASVYRGTLRGESGPLSIARGGRG